MKQFKKIIALALALVLSLSLAACASKTETAASTETASTETASETTESKGTITVAASPTPHAEILAQAKPILEAEGWTLEVKEFQDYVQPNNVVESGEFDENFFQHIPYLEDFNAQNGTHLVSAGAVHYEPMGLYVNPAKAITLDSIPDGATIAIPNDTTNEARALLLLQDNGILKLKDGAGLTATVLDIEENPYNVGLDAAILMNPQTWVASGHLAGFSDPLMDCRECKERFRADKLIEDWCQQESVELPKPIDAFTQQEMKDFIEEHNIPCPSCGKHNFTDIRQFNLMFKTFQGVTEDAKNTVYLRPETAQGIFTNFVNTQRTTRRKLPFGVCQIGKSFRNEITPGNFIFRVREFEQMELEFFCEPGTDLEWLDYWRKYCKNFLLSLNMTEDAIRQIQ